MKLRIVYFLFIIILFNYCKDPYDFTIKKETNYLLVNGNISDGPGPYYLELGRSASFETLNYPLTVYPVDDAIITLFDNLNNGEFFTNVGKGRYKINGDIIKGENGKTYWIEITLSNGEIYRSQPEAIPLEQAEDSVSFKVVSKNRISEYGLTVSQTNVNIILNTMLPSSAIPTSYFRWGVDELFVVHSPGQPSIWCYVFQNLACNIETIKTSDFSNPYINEITLAEKPVDYSFLENHFFITTQYSISEKAYQYWKKVKAQTERGGSIFEVPPANIKGNIYNINDPDEKVFGYFEASAQKKIYTRVTRGDIKIELSCNQIYYCNNCPSIPGSSQIKPDWFYP